MVDSWFNGYNVPSDKRITSLWRGTISTVLIDLLDSTHLNVTSIGGVIIRLFTASSTISVQVGDSDGNVPSATLTTANGIVVTDTVPFIYSPSLGNDQRLTVLKAIAGGAIANVEVIGLE